MTEIPDLLNSLAQKHFNIDYVFPYQRLVISNILRAAGAPGFEIDPEFEDELAPQQIVLLPTGAGKSLCFMLPSFLLDGITIVVFPILSLLSDQLRRCEEASLSAVILRGGQSKEERKEIFSMLENGQVKMVLTNPETLRTSRVLEKIKELPISHMVIDETHTVSEWGDTFRPAYLEMKQIIEVLSPSLTTAFTATASAHILKRIQEVLFPDSNPNIIYGNPDRNNIQYSVIETKSPMNTLFQTIKNVEKPLIIFSSSRTSVELTADFLRRELDTNEIYFYHAGLTKVEKDKVEKWFFHSDDGILTATCAYGMGVDKSNIRTVIHTEPPSTVEAYLQESGRAGRDRQASKAILLFSPLIRKKSGKIQEEFSRKRFLSMIEYCENTEQCRREQLLAMLNSEPEICSGCDVCQKTLNTDYSFETVLRLVKKNKRRFLKKDFIFFLKGYRTANIKNQRMHLKRGYSDFHDWSTEMIEEMIDLLIETGALKLPGKGFRKHRLTI